MALSVLFYVLTESQPFDSTLVKKRFPNLKKSDSAFICQLVLGVLRWFVQLEWIVSLYLSTPLKKKDYDVKLLLLLGLFQLEKLNTPPHAAVNETVAACDDIYKPWAKKLINAVLKNAANNTKPKPSMSLEHLTAHPAWLIKILSKDWGNQLSSILHQNNILAPLVIRVNAKKMPREAYLNILAAHSITAEICQFSHTGILLPAAPSVTSLPGFREGLFYVQDQSAQLAAELLELHSGLTILDACSAPGGKTSHIIEQTQGNVQMIANEMNSKKIAIINENMARLGHQCLLLNRDASELHTLYPPNYFDRILCDVPCSGTGVIRRHPDIKLLRTQAEIEALCQKQKILLKSLWPLLKPNGILLYATCSILKQENENQIADFMASTTDAICTPIDAEWGISLTYGKQILPGMNDNMDGFYYAKLTKTG